MTCPSSLRTALHRTRALAALVAAGLLVAVTAAPVAAADLPRLTERVTDEADVLRAFNWSDFEPKVSRWVARRYPAARSRRANWWRCRRRNGTG